MKRTHSEGEKLDVFSSCTIKFFFKSNLFWFISFLDSDAGWRQISFHVRSITRQRSRGIVKWCPLSKLSSNFCIFWRITGWLPLHMLLNIITINHFERKRLLSGSLFSISASCPLIASSRAKELRLPPICSAAAPAASASAQECYRCSFLSCTDVADVADVAGSRSPSSWLTWGWRCVLCWSPCISSSWRNLARCSALCLFYQSRCLKNKVRVTGVWWLNQGHSCRTQNTRH